MSGAGRLYYLVGPSGAGKDSILAALKQKCYAEHQPLVAHRYITRAVREGDENHIQLNDADFERRKKAGLFLFDWQSHGNRYAIGREVGDWVASSINVIVNGSRQYLPVARRRFPLLLMPVSVSVKEATIRDRLMARGRENPDEIEARIKHNRLLEASIGNDCLKISNDLSIDHAVAQLLKLMPRPASRLVS